MYESLTKNRQERLSSIELLRILSMQMIVFYHFSIYGGFTWQTDTITIQRLWYNLLSMWGKVGVNIFVLISGYFMIESSEKAIKANRLIKLWGQVFFYSLLIILIFYSFELCSIDISSLIKTFFPLSLSSWWFASSYFVLLLIRPFLNLLLRNLNKAEYQSLILLAIILRSIIPTLTASTYPTNDIIWFITLYAIAGYIRIFGLNKKYTSKQYFYFFIASSLFTYGTSAILSVLGTKWSRFANYYNYFYGQDRITILLISLSLFMVFAEMKMNNHKPINVIASATFGVYLIHDNELVRQFLWRKLLYNSPYQDSWLIIPYSIVVVEMVYIVCTLIDLTRQKLFERTCMALMNRFFERLIRPFSITFNYIKDNIL